MFFFLIEIFYKDKRPCNIFPYIPCLLIPPYATAKHHLSLCISAPYKTLITYTLHMKIASLEAIFFVCLHKCLKSLIVA